MTDRNDTNPVFLRQKMTEKITNIFAVGILSDPAFPTLNRLPPLQLVRHNYLGHQILIDYRRLARILWGVILDMDEAVRRVENLQPEEDKSSSLLKRITSRPLPAILVLTTAGLLSLWLLWDSIASLAHVLATLILVGSALALTFLLYYRPKPPPPPERQRYFDIELAGIRFSNIKALLNAIHGQQYDSLSMDRFEAQLDLSEARWVSTSDGTLSGIEAPILVAFDRSDPFPGYGRLQATQTFVVRPEEKLTAQNLSAVEAKIEESLRSVSKRVGIASINVGKVVVVSGATVFMGSAWMDRGVPRLYCNPHHAPQLDPRVESRVYSALEVLLPQHLTTATFFVRCFSVGKSIACEVSICTLGPPKLDASLASDMLAVYSSLDETERREGKSAVRQQFAMVQWRIDGEEIHRLAQALVYRAHAKPEPHEGAVLASGAYHGAAEGNWRAKHSLALAPGYFASGECRVTVRTLYEQLSRGVLEVLDEAGYDISPYRDSGGHLIVNAEKIEQMIVGTNVYNEPQRDESRGSTTRSAASAEPATAASPPQAPSHAS